MDFRTNIFYYYFTANICNVCLVSQLVFSSFPVIKFCHYRLSLQAGLSGHFSYVNLSAKRDILVCTGNFKSLKIMQMKCLIVVKIVAGNISDGLLKKSA